MPIRPKKGYKIGFRYRKLKDGRKQRIGGYMRKGRFVKVKEVVTFKGKRKIKTKRFR